jgi:glucose/arabinose dehydrogenase
MTMIVGLAAERDRSIRRLGVTWSKAGAVALACLIGAAEAAGAQSAIDLELVVDGLERPVFVSHAGDGSGRLFVLEQAGRIRIVEGGALRARSFLDLTDRVRSGGERGLLGLAFHPDFAANRRLFIDYTRQPDGATVIAEFRAARLDPDRARPIQRRLLTVPQPFSNHNGGMLAFGPDGRLYIALGDGGGAGDPGDRAQDPSSLLGKILRIDVDGARPYAIPPGNPFADGGGRPEIFALGLRNPWRFSFDRRNGHLLAGDVGQGRNEEIDIIRRGHNYGWPIMEGPRCFRPPFGCDPSGLTLPVSTYRHIRGRCSITGGYVYRGAAIRALVGTYLAGDFCSGEIFGLRRGKRALLLETELQISSFGEDEAGEIYVVDLGGAVYRIVSVVD